MNSCKAHRSRFFFRANPDRPGTANEREGIVSDDLCRTLYLQLDRIVGKRANRSEFIRG
jgi:hypothetical protein